jgi:hypothetical protein
MAVTSGQQSTRQRDRASVAGSVAGAVVRHPARPALVVAAVSPARSGP